MKIRDTRNDLADQSWEKEKTTPLVLWVVRLCHAHSPFDDDADTYAAKKLKAFHD